LTRAGNGDWNGSVIQTRPQVSADSVTFHLADAGGRDGAGPVLGGARLLPALSLPGAGLDFAYAGGQWRLTLPRPPVQRMEYRFQVRHPAGDTEEICDPGNPLRAPGAFGDKSVVEFPGYAVPGWLDAEPVPGSFADPAPWVRVWTPADASGPLPMLVAHDGPEYDRLAGLTRFAAAMIHMGRLPACRVALLAPGDRDDEYSANPDHAAALRDLLGSLDPLVAGPVVGMGASLGGLAMLHAQRTYPGLFGGLFLQSASFLDTRLDPQEADRFSRFDRVSAYTARVLREEPAQTVPVVLTCGLAEENLANNRQMAAALRAQGYDARLVEVPDAHNYVGWRDAFDPPLADLLRALWGVA
jgi:enterochelin esterase-like enzyme